MEVAASSSSIILTSSPVNTRSLSRNRVNQNYSEFPGSLRLIRNRRVTTRISAINEVSSAADSGQIGVTWQIIVGSIAGVTPFVVAGIEFNKRIIAQKRCEECGGSGLVLREKEYFRCPECGGFLPWQSWKRFFST
ncbi:uncharacterized protein [Euphorbia lathyris]|uniref:uncharacterized protein n=1 Tax=Euphorbia lathyris TaxID=212925 RepID=UPI003313783A